jgi:hypothetical protein
MRYISEGIRTWILAVLIIITALNGFFLVMDSEAEPVVNNKESLGSWTDIFNDTSGIESQNNITVNTRNVRLNSTGINWTHEYTANVEPDDDGWNLITNSGGDLAIVNGGILNLDTTPENVWWWYNKNIGASNAVGTTYEINMKVNSVSFKGLTITLRDGTWYEGLFFYPDRIEMFVDVPIVYFMDTTDTFHTYRLTFKNNDYMVYVDGVLVLDGTDGLSASTGANLCQFGDTDNAAGVDSYSEWDYIRYNVSGAFPPEPVIYNTSGELVSSEISLPAGMTWDSLYINKTEPGTDNFINISVLNGSTSEVIPGYENLIGTNIDISSIDHIAYPTLKLLGTFVGNSSDTPVLHDWSVTWADTIPPATPVGLKADNPFTGYSLVISWHSNKELDLSGYSLYYSTDNSTFEWLLDFSPNSLLFLHSGLDTGTIYYYKIAAYDEVPNQSPFSEVAIGIPDIDTDNDGIGNIIDDDDDGDTVPDIDDEFPLSPNEWIDTDGDGIGNNADMDDDNDTYYDVNDDFPFDDSEWNDLDNDGIGDNSDPDIDGDGYNNTLDEFDNNPNEWTDFDGDGIGNNVDMDDDEDGFYDSIDDFPYDDSEWNDTDHDGIGDNSDEDIDGDGYYNTLDDFPKNPNEWIDSDGDSIGDNADMDDDDDGYEDSIDDFPLDDLEWNDSDFDGIGDNSDDDIDGDGINNTIDDFDYNPHEWLDTDADGIGNNADLDDDDDGYEDDIDDFTHDDSEYNDMDYDGIGDNSDDDIDGDGIINAIDVFPNDAEDWEDMDKDGIGDNKDSDIDGDGVNNYEDVFAYDATESSDLDRDRIGDNSDDDKDGDGVSNEEDAFPENVLEWEDNDGDGIGDNADSDDDDDDYPDINDEFPYDDTEWADLDSDGIGDTSDTDKDGDGVLNTADKFPTLKSEWVDFDEDGIGDFSDLDDDNDGHLDYNDDYPYDRSKWQKPNELLPLLYLILILLAVLILIGVLLNVNLRKGKIFSVDKPYSGSKNQGYTDEDIRETEDVENPAPKLLSSDSQKEKFPPPPPVE